VQGATVTDLDTSALENVRGEIIRPEDDRYDEARAIHNAGTDKHPALVVRSRDVADVISVVNFARSSGLPLAVRGGGHNPAGFSSVDDGIVLDLSKMRGIKVDPIARTATVQGGCTWGDVDHATHAFGLAAPGGVVSTTGVGGLTLGGGTGHLTRSCGLTVDNLLEADVVLAEGTFVTANDQQNDDLFWALRGGGGNFGVVTSLTFRLHSVDMVVAGPMLWPLDQAAEALRMYEQLLAGAPDELTGIFAFLVVPPGPPFPEDLHLKTVCGIVWCYTGPREGADDVLAPARALGPPVFELVGPMPHPILQSMFDGIAGPGMHNYWRGDFLRELTAEAIVRHVEYGSTVPNVFSGVHLYPVDGVAGRVAPDATAWNYRDARWAEVIFAADPAPASFDSLKDWVVESWDLLHPFSMGGGYVNFLVEEGQERVQASYRDNYVRLAELKARYDPTNLFRLNQNIEPAG
jgi:FAD binding domain/Berberine and berberine like